jgi:hypothetical protein
MPGNPGGPYPKVTMELLEQLLTEQKRTNRLLEALIEAVQDQASPT